MSEFVPDPNSPYLIDECKIRGNAERVIIPDDESELSSVLNDADSSKTPVTISGFRTGLCGGSVPFGGILVSMERFSSIIGIGEDEGKRRHGNRFDDETYGNTAKFAFFWSADDSSEGVAPGSARVWYLTSKSMAFGYMSKPKNFGFSVRCVR